MPLPLRSPSLSSPLQLTPSSTRWRIWCSITATASPSQPIRGDTLPCVKRNTSVLTSLIHLLKGGSRLETIGDIVYAGVMGSVSVVLIVRMAFTSPCLFSPLFQAFSIQQLVKGSTGKETFHIPAVVVVGIAFRQFLRLFFNSLSTYTSSYEAGSLHLLFLCEIQKLTGQGTLGGPVSVHKPGSSASSEYNVSAETTFL